MNAIRAFAAFAFVAALIGSMLTVATPIAHADPLDGVRGPVNGVRQSSACPPLNYSVALEGEAQFLSGNNLPGVPPRGQYKGTFQAFGGAGDPASAAINDAVGKATPTIKNCSFKDYGVGFLRQDNMNPPDHVAVVLGQPAAPPAANTTCPDGSTVPAGQQCPVKPATTTCPDGSTVPAGQQCKPATTACPGGSTVPAGQTCPVTNAITAKFDDPGLTKAVLRVQNSSNLTAACHYDAKANTNNPLVPKNTTRDFTVPANGKDVEEFKGAPTQTTYTVTITCKDASGKQTQDIGDQNLTLKW
jgi:hypothetical protein